MYHWRAIPGSTAEEYSAKAADNASLKLPKGDQWKAFNNIGEHLFYIDDLFPQVHRSSLFLTIYAFFEFELDFLCGALGNYYKLNDAFTFESSIDELNEYTESH